MATDAQIPEWQVEEISDPFDVFPLQQALRGLGQLMEDNKDELFARYEDVAPQYREIGLEQGLEAISIIIGAGFVAAQSILARTYSSVKTIAKSDIVLMAGGANIPKVKSGVFRIAAFDRSGVPDIIGIHALANYFKHASEWPQDRGELTRPLEIETAVTVTEMGLRSGDPDNMTRGARFLNFGGRDGLLKLATRVQEWREAVAIEIKQRLRYADLLRQ